MNEISVLLHTSENRGDHAADIVEAHKVNEGETVAELVDRLLGRGMNGKPEDRIELRIVK